MAQLMLQMCVSFMKTTTKMRLMRLQMLMKYIRVLTLVMIKPIPINIMNLLNKITKMITIFNRKRRMFMIGLEVLQVPYMAIYSRHVIC